MRKHRAPNGALRRGDGDCVGGVFVGGEKAPSAKRCIKTGHLVCVLTGARRCQKAPSAKRCIKTVSDIGVTVLIRRARKHRAPKGALRLLTLIVIQFVYVPARKHRAPKGALRLIGHLGQTVGVAHSQKAPSAKRCIKTSWPPTRRTESRAVRKHRAPNGALRRRDRCRRTHHGLADVRKHRAQKGALRPVNPSRVRLDLRVLESTERQKVH